MSHRSEMETYAIEMAKRKKTVMTVIKVISALLAAALLATAVFVIVDIVNDNVSSEKEGENGTSYIQATQGKKITVKQHSTPQYRSYVAFDEKAGYELEVIPNGTTDTVGTYTVSYKLKDGNGKILDTLKITIVVEAYDEAWEELEPLIIAKGNELGITKDMNKVDIVKKIYSFVNDGIPYRSTSVSHTGNDRSKWQENWVKEALLTIKTMEGDCYSNYSLSKAFFEYYGIENQGIMRSENDGGLAGTHFWNVVNIGTEQKPAWYYYDSTELKGTFSDGTRDASLMTLDKLWSYNSDTIKKGTASTTFYAFDPSKYPTVETTPLS